MKAKSLLLTSLFFLSILTGIKAQEEINPKNSIYLELLGNGGLYSINYDRQFKTNLYGRIGFGSFKSIDFLDPENKDRITTIPLLISYLTGHNLHHFEMGGGMLFGGINETEGLNTFIDLTAYLGYRYQAPGKGILIRIGLTPFLSLDKKTNYPDEGLFLSGGISLGYHF